MKQLIETHVGVQKSATYEIFFDTKKEEYFLKTRGYKPKEHPKYVELTEKVLNQNHAIQQQKILLEPTVFKWAAGSIKPSALLAVSDDSPELLKLIKKFKKTLDKKEIVKQQDNILITDTHYYAAVLPSFELDYDVEDGEDEEQYD